MNSITGNTIDSYNYDGTNTSSIPIQSSSNATSNSNTSTKNSATTSDTIDISTTKTTAFFKTVNEVDSEIGNVQQDGNNVSSAADFFTAIEFMKDEGYNIPSLDSNSCDYSSLIDEMKDFLSKNSNTLDSSFSSNLSSFCDTLKERLNTYGIS